MPLRKVRLPKIVPPKAKGLLEEYFYYLLVAIFVGVAILGKAGGLSGYNAVVVGAWLAASLWFARQLKDYFVEKSEAPSGKVVEAGKAVETVAKVQTQRPKGLLLLSPRMKPVIGPQRPAKTGPRPARPRQTAAPSKQVPGALDNPNKPFVYERPTLPDRKPKLPHNWQPQEHKKPKP